MDLQPGQCVKVIDNETLLRELVAAHQDLHWTQLCELQCGCSGILREVHRIDRSAKLEPCILKDGAVQALQGVQWLPIEALEPLHHELPELTADDGGVVDSEAPADASAKAARERDEEWTVSSGRTFPLDVVVLTMSGAEIRIKVASLGDRLEDLRGKVAAAAKKDHLQVMLSSDGQMLPEEGTLEKIADLLAQEASLQLVIQPRQLRPGVVKRLQKELADYSREPLEGVSIAPEETDSLPISDRWEAWILGPVDTPYAGGVFHLRVKFPRDYPFRPPNVRFTTPIWTPDVNTRHGSVDVDFLSAGWSPALTVAKALQNLISLLKEPTEEGCANMDAHEQLRRSPEAFRDQAAEWTRKYAM